MDPYKSECIGYYGYGNGYLAIEGKVGKFDGNMYCNICKSNKVCWDKLRERVDAEYPIEVVAFQAAIDQGANGGELAAKLAREGRPDPWMRDMMRNMQGGMDERV